MARYKWVTHEGERLYQVGILANGRLYNPRGYPDDVVRAAVLAADQRRRSEAAKKAAVTRERRQNHKVYLIAERLAAGGSAGPSLKCACCDRGLTDADSVARGIGSQCWQGILDVIERLRTAQQAGEQLEFPN
jgi:hypothetical protein